ncbi:HDIG domain-containing protein [Fervidobacterium changbaicum]|uniref:HD domain-containing protein n=2 Tax=Fervidobacterium TaxID=2422 RepID=A0AAI8CM89_FERIS|nr:MULTISPECIES: response regulator [Fervidobacterium]AMW33006.1 HD domain-containing protein [Fervidobacterium islandicum]QAV33048.1 two-component system response regulator [Fervidobacterium changbaicum]SDH02414.1 HDIG domain-containing protein [Fervidobacterium changbaicum]
MERTKILIVDDSKTVHSELTAILSDIYLNGKVLDIEHAYGFEDFRKIFVPEKYALVITDLVMERDDSGIQVINHIRHTYNDKRTRIILMTANPEKIPSDLLTKDYDVNAYLEKNHLSPFSMKLTVLSMLKTYEDIVSLERAIVTLENVTANATEMSLEELLINTFFQVRTFLSLKRPDIKLNGEIFVNNERIFPPKFIKSEPLEHRYDFQTKVQENRILFNIYSSKELNTLEISYVRSLLKNLQRSVISTRYPDVEEEFVIMLSKVVEAKSEETGDHVNRVAELSGYLAEALGFNSSDANLIKKASALHDIGKVGVPDYILNKPEKLNDKEFAVIKEHSMIGFEILRDSTLNVFEIGAVVALEHHERWDGTGYPYGLQGEEIAIEARIVQVADVFEALTHARCYRPAWPVEKAVEYMNDMKGQQFDPKVVEAFNKHLKDMIAIVTSRYNEEVRNF